MIVSTDIEVDDKSRADDKIAFFVSLASYSRRLDSIDRLTVVIVLTE
jgi:hypothetical protein